MIGQSSDGRPHIKLEDETGMVDADHPAGSDGLLDA